TTCSLPPCRPRRAQPLIPLTTRRTCCLFIRAHPTLRSALQHRRGPASDSLPCNSLPQSARYLPSNPLLSACPHPPPSDQDLPHPHTGNGSARLGSLHTTPGFVASSHLLSGYLKCTALRHSEAARAVGRSGEGFRCYRNRCPRQDLHKHFCHHKQGRKRQRPHRSGCIQPVYIDSTYRNAGSHRSSKHSKGRKASRTQPHSSSCNGFGTIRQRYAQGLRF
ncbi:hypothetical protein C8F01DRAFT_1235512, partial [Mycena amicta]